MRTRRIPAGTMSSIHQRTRAFQGGIARAAAVAAALLTILSGCSDLLSNAFLETTALETTALRRITFSAGTDISTSALNAQSVYATDLDGDGDADVLSASSLDDRIVWYENTDGNGTFGAGTNISTTADAARSVYATDLDGDGDADVLSASEADNRVVWYENRLDQVEADFSAGTNISITADGAYSVFATDLDSDGDADVLSASIRDDRIVWYKNTDGNGSFSAGTDISTTVDDAWAVFATDLDGDGDADVLAVALADDRIIWFENRLNQLEADFSSGTDISTTAHNARSVYATDLDGDGDADVLSASAIDDRIVWYENTDGNGTFSAGTDISTTADYAQSVYAADLDGDGDADVLSASFLDDRIVWYENTDGNGTFSAGTNISTTADRANSVYATDLNGDGLPDVLSASLADNRIVWYENQTVVP